MRSVKRSLALSGCALVPFDLRCLSCRATEYTPAKARVRHTAVLVCDLTDSSDSMSRMRFASFTATLGTTAARTVSTGCQILRSIFTGHPYNGAKSAGPTSAVISASQWLSVRQMSMPRTVRTIGDSKSAQKHCYINLSTRTVGADDINSLRHGLAREDALERATHREGRYGSQIEKTK